MTAPLKLINRLKPDSSVSQNDLLCMLDRGSRPAEVKRHHSALNPD